MRTDTYHKQLLPGRSGGKKKILRYTVPSKFNRYIYTDTEDYTDNFIEICQRFIHFCWGGERRFALSHRTLLMPELSALGYSECGSFRWICIISVPCSPLREISAPEMCLYSNIWIVLSDLLVFYFSCEQLAFVRCTCYR